MPKNVRHNLMYFKEKCIIKVESTVNERLSSIVDTFEKGVKSAFAQKIGISPQGVHDLLTARKGLPSFKVLSSILENYTQVRSEWLILGQGNMLKEGSEVEGYPDTEALFATLSADLVFYNKKLAQRQEKLLEHQEKQRLIDAELSFLHALPDVDSVEDELFGRSMMFAEEMSRRNRVDIDNDDAEIKSIHSRLAALHKRTVELLENKPSAVASGPPPIPKSVKLKSPLAPMKSSGIVT